MKRVSILLLEFMAGLAGNLIAGWLQQDVFNNVFSTVRIVGTVVGVLFVLLIITWMERPKKNDEPLASAASTNHLPRVIDNNKDGTPMSYDVFISHASEDKEAFVHPLAVALDNAGYKVWYDEFSLQVGDSLPASINYGLANSRYGIVVLSIPFFKKDWPTAELDGLFMRQMAGKKVILPIWHEISQEEVLQHSPILASKLAVSTHNKSAAQIVEALKPVLDQP